MTDLDPPAATWMLEIVRVRCTAATVEAAEAGLRELLAASGGHVARLVRSATAPHDLALLLRSRCPSDGPPVASALGQRVAASLRDFGPVSHGLWIEIAVTPSVRKEMP
ncbi:MAG: hypothetical protein AAFX50_13260 [Acidobacteriota bacterium]